MNASLPKVHTFKGWYHVSLVIAAVAEAFTAKTNMRRLLLGGCAGWHLYAVYEHFLREPKENLKTPSESWYRFADGLEEQEQVSSPIFTDEKGRNWVDDRPLDIEKLRRDRRNTWGNHDD